MSGTSQRTEQLSGPMPGLAPSDRTEAALVPASVGGTMRLADIDLLSKIGEGGNATVHLGVHRPTGRRIAVKLIHDKLRADPKFVGRFEREVRASSTIVHRNVCAVLGWGDERGALFLAMELIEGASLHELIALHGPLPAQVAAELVDQLLDAVGAAHAIGVLHRDVKPGNMMVTRDGVLKLLDFGIAKGEHDLRVTETGMLVGTPAYMSPEHATGQDIDARSDLYACGVTLFEMLVGDNPYASLNPSTALLKIATEAIPPIFERDMSAPGALELLFERLTARRVDHRFATAADARAALQGYLAFVRGRHPDVVRYWLEAPAERKASLDREMAEVEVLRARALEAQGEASLPAAALALRRAAKLDPTSTAIQQRLRVVAARAKVQLDPPADAALLRVIDEATKVPSPGALKRAADLCRTQGYIQLAVGFLRRYLKERPLDTHAQQQLEVLVAGTAPPEVVPTPSGALRTSDIIAGVKTGQLLAVASASPSTSPSSAGAPWAPFLASGTTSNTTSATTTTNNNNNNNNNNAAGRARLDPSAPTLEVRARIAAASTSTPRTGLAGPLSGPEESSGALQAAGYAALGILVVAGLAWAVRALVFTEVVATQRLVSDNQNQVGMVEQNNAVRRRENLILDARAQLNQSRYNEAILTTNELLADGALPASSKAEALYLRGMAYRALHEPWSARRELQQYLQVAPTTDVHYAEVKHLIDELSVSGGEAPR